MKKNMAKRLQDTQLTKDNYNNIDDTGDDGDRSDKLATTEEMKKRM